MSHTTTQIIRLGAPHIQAGDWGAGPHYCLGASAVGALFTVVLEEVPRRMPTYELSDEDGIGWFADLSSVPDVNALPIPSSSGAKA
jgi:cytochrome P450